MTDPIRDQPTRILLIEDSVTYVFLLRASLESVTSAQFVMTHVERLSEGLQRLTEDQFDVVLVDLGLPDSQGLETVVRVCGHAPSVPVLALTALTDEATALRAMQLGVQDYLVKGPGQVDANALLRSIRYAIERKRIERALLESEERYRTVAETASDVIVTIDEDSTIIFVNPAVEKLFGYTPQEMLDQKLTLLMPERLIPSHLAALKRYIATGQRRIGWERIELFGRHKSGDEVPIEVSFGEFIKDGRRFFTGIMRDISERKLAQEVQANLEEQLRQSQKMESIGRLAGGVAHDFNNLITVIQMYSDIMKNQMPADDPLLKKVQQIRLASERAATLTRQLLAFSRKQILAPVVLDLSELVANLQLMLERLIGEDIKLSTALQPELWSIIADPGQMEQVLMNLVVNARDAMPTGGMITIETRNVQLDKSYAGTHLDTPLGPCVMLAATDTGHGMDAQTCARIFEPFFTTKPAGDGTGLGLATVHGIVKQSGGNILVYSEPGNGTTFKIYLPAGDSVPHDATPSQTRSDAKGGTETILLVEDEEMVRNLVQAVLEEIGYTILEAHTVGEASSLCEQHQGSIDLLLTDVIMPHMSGRELAEQLKALRPQMKVLFMSGYTDDAVVRHGVLTAEVEFLPKPFSADALERKVREVLDK